MPQYSCVIATGGDLFGLSLLLSVLRRFVEVTILDEENYFIYIWLLFMPFFLHLSLCIAYGCCGLSCSLSCVDTIVWMTIFKLNGYTGIGLKHSCISSYTISYIISGLKFFKILIIWE